LFPCRNTSTTDSFSAARRAYLFPRILELLEEKLPHRRHKLYRQIDESFRDDERYTVWGCREGDRGEEVPEGGLLGETVEEVFEECLDWLVFLEAGWS
jgi:hypothetical protein